MSEFAVDKDLSDVVIIHFLDNEYERDHRRSNIEGLSRYCRVICIEPPITILSLVRNFRSSIKSLFNRKIHKTFHRTIEYYRPIMIVPYAVSCRLNIMELANRCFLFISLGKIRQSTRGKKRVVFVTCPQQTCVLRTVHEDILYYECCDLYSKRPGLSPAAGRRIQDKEMFLASQCDIIATTSKELFNRMVIHNSNTHYIPNSADVNLFESVMSSDAPTPDDLKTIPKPWIGLIGYLSELVDVDLLISIAERRRSWSLILIGDFKGPISFSTHMKIRKLNSYYNVHMIGYKPYDVVPLYQKLMDVCLICYKLNEYTDCVHPNKLSQYLSQNKRFVSTAIKELYHYGGLGRTAKTIPEFEDAVAESLLEAGDAEMSLPVKKYLSENCMEKSTARRLELISVRLDGSYDRAGRTG